MIMLPIAHLLSRSLGFVAFKGTAGMLSRPVAHLDEFLPPEVLVAFHAFDADVELSRARVVLHMFSPCERARNTL